MSQTLYRKYRPQTFGEVIGQKHIVQTLTNALKHDRVSQAYLFTGPRGTGKTTLARIFAKAVNCEKRKGFEPCGKCAVCQNIAAGRSLDIIEIDAASNTGVDNIRELRETVKLPPTQARYKVYIIDEVHMLSTGAFNALLKTLEEPPAHVIFILATTEIHKIPETILSRVQRFDFVRLPMDNIIQKLSAIAQKEGVEVEKEALEMIALAAEGGMRDAESLLSQVISLEDKKITADEVKEILGTTDHQLVEQMGELILRGEAEKSLELLNQIAHDGLDLEIFCKSLLNYLRQVMILSVDPSLETYFSYELSAEQLAKAKELAGTGKISMILRTIEALLEAKIRIKTSFIPQLPLELAILKSIRPESFVEEKIQRTPAPADRPVPAPPKPAAALQERTRDIPAARTAELVAAEISDSGKKVELIEISDRWEELLRNIKPLNHSLILFLSNCQPLSIENNVLTIATQYSFYKDKLSEHANKALIENELGKLFGTRIRTVFTDHGYQGNAKAAETNTGPKSDESPNPLLSEAMKLFGGKIVEE